MEKPFLTIIAPLLGAPSHYNAEKAAIASYIKYHGIVHSVRRKPL